MDDDVVLAAYLAGLVTGVVLGGCICALLVPTAAWTVGVAMVLGVAIVAVALDVGR